MKKRILSMLLVFVMLLSILPVGAFAHETYYPIVTIVPANHSELKPIVKVGDKISEGTVIQINGATIKVQCTMNGAAGSTETFRLPYANQLWDLSSYKVSNISWAAQGGVNKTEGASAPLSSGGASAYYYFDYVVPNGSGQNYLWNFTLQYDANGGSGAPAAQYYGTNDRYTKSYTFKIPAAVPTRDGYKFLGWSKSKNASSPTFQPNGNCLVSQTASGYKGGSVTVTLYAVWEAIPTVNWDGLTITKSANKSTVAPGATVTYTIQVTNGTGTDLVNVTVKDQLPGGLTYQSFSVKNVTNSWDTSNLGAYNSQTGIWTIPVLANGDTVELTIVATVNDNATNGTITNIATITGAKTPGGDTLPDDDPPEADAGITVSAPRKRITDFTKALVTDETVLPDDFDTNNLNVTIPEDGATSVNAPGGSVTLMYKMTVTGQAGANFVITDEDATLVYPTTGVTQDDTTGLISGTIPEGATSIDIYVIKEFSRVTQGQALYNTASIAPGSGSKLDDSIEKPEVQTDPIMALVPPGTSEVTSILTDQELVTVDCTNTGVSHADGKYPLLDGSYTIGDVEGVSNSDGIDYTCDITISPDLYVAKYNETLPGHTLDPDGQKGIITLSWDGRNWAPVVAERSTAVPQVLFTVKCETPEPQKYPVKYHIVGQSELAHQDTITSETVETYQFWKPAEVEGYTFDGWYEKEKDIGISGKEAKLPLGLKKYELYGKYVANQYTVQFDSNGGTGSMDDQEFTYDVAQDLTLNKFTHEHYRFAGWNTKQDGTGTSYYDEQSVKNLTAVDGDTVTLYAQWTQLYPVYLVIYRNGDTTAPYKSEYIDELAIDDTLKINFDIADYYDGATEYEFDGWYDSYTADGPGNKLGESITIAGETHIYCMVTDYEKVVVMTVTNGDKDNAETIYTGTTLHGTKLIDYLNEKVTVPAKTGYTVDKWFNWDSYDNKFADDTIVNGWTNVYVTYTANQYKVHFDANGGEGEMEDQSYVYDEEKELTPNSFTREGYTFGGWNTEADGTGVAYADMESVKNLTAEDDGEVTLYAVWDVRTDLSYTVNYIEKYTNKQLHDPKIVTGQTFGTEVTENALDIPGYYKINPTSATITIAVSGNEITFYYMRKYVPPVNPDGPDKPELDKENHVAYVIGYPDGTVRPQNNITRAEVATIFFRLMTEDSRNTYMAKIGQNASFTDVEEGAWYYNAVYTLAEAGILGGYPDGSFKPNEPITRAEFAAVVARFYEDAATGKCEFSDVPAAHWANECIALAEGKGLINGYPDGTFRPEQPINRAETMTLINRVLERAVKEEDMLEDMITWSDNLPGVWYYEAVQEATNSHEYVRTEEKVDQNGIKQEYCYEDWTKIEDVPDWAALEKSWAEKNAQ